MDHNPAGRVGGAGGYQSPAGYELQHDSNEAPEKKRYMKHFLLNMPAHGDAAIMISADEEGKKNGQNQRTALDQAFPSF